MHKKLLLSLSLLILASMLLTACGGAQAIPTPAVVPPTDLVVAEGHILPNADVKLTFAVRGQVAEILVKEGQRVAKGDALVRLRDRQAANAELLAAEGAYDQFMRTVKLSTAQAWDAYQKAQLARGDAQLAWEKVDPNNIQDQIDTANTDVQDKKKALDDAKEALDKYLDLRSDNPTRRQAETDLRTAEANYNAAIRKVEDLQRQIDAPRAALDATVAAEAEAKRAYELGKDGPNPEQKDLLAARLAAAQDAFDNYELKAPFAGVVTDVNTTVGELIGPDKYAVQIADISQWFVETSDLTELEVVKVKEGEKVQIAPDALPGVSLAGMVESISQVSKVQGGDVLYTVRIRLDDTDPLLRWGMTVQTTFNP